VPGLLDMVIRRGFTPAVAVMDKGDDGEPMHAACESRGMRLVIALIETSAVRAGKHKPPQCEHGTWTFAGSDAKRGASKWRWPTSECQPASTWVKASRALRTSSSAASCSAVGSGFVFFATPSSVVVITAPLPPSRQAQRDRAGNTVRSTVPSAQIPMAEDIRGAN
jgi:hypothetical protein